MAAAVQEEAVIMAVVLVGLLVPAVAVVLVMLVVYPADQLLQETHLCQIQMEVQ